MREPFALGFGDCSNIATQQLSTVPSQFEITVRYLLFAVLSGILTASVIYIYLTYRL